MAISALENEAYRIMEKRRKGIKLTRQEKIIMYCVLYGGATVRRS